MADHKSAPVGTGTDEFPVTLTQKAAARLLGVSVSFLRSSSAPRVMLPGNGPGGRPLLRYDRAALLAWAGLACSTALTCSTPQQETPQSARTGG